MKRSADAAAPETAVPRTVPPAPSSTPLSSTLNALLAKAAVATAPRATALESHKDDALLPAGVIQQIALRRVQLRFPHSMLTAAPLSPLATFNFVNFGDSFIVVLANILLSMISIIV